MLGPVVTTSEHEVQGRAFEQSMTHPFGAVTNFEGRDAVVSLLSGRRNRGDDGSMRPGGCLTRTETVPHVVGQIKLTIKAQWQLLGLFCRCFGAAIERCRAYSVPLVQVRSTQCERLG